MDGSVWASRLTALLLLTALGVIGARPTELALYADEDAGLTITEIMYNPAPTPGGGDHEFLELFNAGAEAIDLSGYTFSSGIEYTFPPATTLASRTYLILAASPADFQARYSFLPDGAYAGRLDNGGEQLTLSAGDGQIIFSVDYDDDLPWPLIADGIGFSLVRRGAATSNVDLGDASSWRAATRSGGSPGQADPAGPVDTPAILINEVLAHTDLPQLDAVELYNPTAGPVDIGGWYLSDDRTQPHKYRLPDETIIDAGAYLVLDESQFGFALSSFGEEIFLYSADLTGNLTGYTHGFVFRSSANGVSFGRFQTTVGAEHFPAQRQLSLGEANVGPLVGPLVINRLMYNPSSGDEFVELANGGSEPVALYDRDFPANTWRLNGFGDYILPSGLELDPGGKLLIVPIDPETFRRRYAIEPAVQITGPYTGTLSNSGERITLLRPDRQNLDGSVPYIVVDTVGYQDSAPWPAAADGQGPALERLSASAYGDDPASWHAGDPHMPEDRLFLPIMVR